MAGNNFNTHLSSLSFSNSVHGGRSNRLGSLSQNFLRPSSCCLLATLEHDLHSLSGFEERRMKSSHASREKTQTVGVSISRRLSRQKAVQFGWLVQLEDGFCG